MDASLTVAPEPPRQPAVAALLAQSDAVAARLYPGEYRRPITPDSLATPRTHVLVARLDGAAAGLCVVFERADGSVEVKRMIVEAAARGRGVGRALLDAAHAHARGLGAVSALLEVGTGNTEAQALYRAAGYTPRAPFPPYRPSPISLFMERTLEP